MPKENSLVVTACNIVTKYSVFVLVFLLPLFFLPWTTDILEFNKQALLVFLMAVGFSSVIIKTLISGVFTVRKTKFNYAIGFLLLAYLLSTIFSAGKYGSLWGWPQDSSESLLTIICFALLFFIIINTFSKKDVVRSIWAMVISAFLVEIFGVLQILQITPLSFGQAGGLNTIGLTGALGIFAAIFYPLVFVLLISAKKWWKILFAVQLILTAALVFMINYPVVWWILLIASVLIILAGWFKGNLFDARWMFLPTLFLTIALFFILFNPLIKWLPNKVIEVSISPARNLSIDIETLKERPIFGSGPGTFGYDFSKFKDPNFNKTSFWTVNFDRGSSKVLTNIATLGIFGTLAWLLLLLPTIFYGIALFIFNRKEDGSSVAKEEKESSAFLIFGLLSLLISQSVAFFLYTSNISLDLVYFFALACLVYFVAGPHKNYGLAVSPKAALAVTFFSTIILIFFLGILIMDAQRYVAELSFNKGMREWQLDKDKALKNLEAAASSNPNLDLYYRQLSQAYLLMVQSELADTQKSQEAKSSNIQKFITNAINSAQRATDLGPKNASNWSVRAFVYQSLIGLIPDTENWALKTYDEAIKLDPNNPNLFAQKGMVLFSQARNLGQDKENQKQEILSQAEALLVKAVELNPNFSNGFFYLGLVYDAMSQKDKAINAFSELQKLNPENKDIQKIINNLKEGKPALESPGQEQSVIENTTPGNQLK
jgi:tetratricopeptide (TPR) repeat protein